MRRLIITIAAVLLALGGVEGLAYWWMHPSPAGLGEPVLVYRPSRSVGVSPTGQKFGNSDQGTKIIDRGSKIDDGSATGSSSNQPSTLNSQPSTSSSSSPLNLQSPISNLSSLTPLPEIVSRALPSLRCTTGTAARIDRDDGVTIHVAFFEWDLSSSTNVLEAFKHLPDECMGSIGMTLIEKAPVRTFVVNGQGAGDVNQAENQKSKIKNQQSSISPSSLSTLNPQPSTSSSPLSNHSLTFDHTVFRDPGGVVVHAFKGTWVSGSTALLGEGVRGGVEQWNQLRWKSALKRFRPAHARVVQGAVRGIPNPDVAWEAFEDAMLADLTFER